MPNFRAARIENGVVADLWEVPSLTAFDGIELISAPDGVGMGWSYAGGVFADNRPPPIPVIPQVVTMRQARLALLSAGKLAAVATAIAALPSPQKEAMQIEWEYATEVRRASPHIKTLMGALGFDDAALDVLFVQAAKL